MSVYDNGVCSGCSGARHPARIIPYRVSLGRCFFQSKAPVELVINNEFKFVKNSGINTKADQHRPA